jgi:hypothetical protein
MLLSNCFPAHASPKFAALMNYASLILKDPDVVLVCPFKNKNKK